MVRSDLWFLRFPSDGKWDVTDDDHKASGDAASWLSSTRSVSDPMSVSEWQLYADSKWQIQSSVKLRSAHVPPPAAKITISGATGADAAQINGVYTYDSPYHGYPCWKSSSGHWLLRFPSDGAWNVASDDRKASGKSGGWLSSAPTDVDYPMMVSSWQVWDGTEWQTQSVQLSTLETSTVRDIIGPNRFDVV